MGICQHALVAADRLLPCELGLDHELRDVKHEAHVKPTAGVRFFDLFEQVGVEAEVEGIVRWSVAIS